MAFETPDLLDSTIYSTWRVGVRLQMSLERRSQVPTPSQAAVVPGNSIYAVRR